jgi:hypothetical protein
MAVTGPGETLETDGGARLPATLKPLSPQPHLFIALECDRPLAGPSRHALGECDEVSIGRGLARSFSRTPRGLQIAIPDARTSARHARLVRTGNVWSIEDLGSRNGLFVDGARCKRGVLSDGSLVLLGHTLLLFRNALPSSKEPPWDVDGERLSPSAPGLETLLPRLANDFAALERLAPSGVPILVEGEIGTGKELIARAVHQLTLRKGPLVAVNCGALPPNLIESELFGHVRGAFSGAVQERPGLVRAAHGGTLFLDEIGELPLTAQVAFLRVLQERKVIAIGSTRSVDVDIALVSATHRDLPQLVQTERFRGDLFARVAGFRFKLPRLAERREDLGFVLRALLTQHGQTRATFSPAAAEALFRFDWPLNVRELEHALRTALALAPDHHIDLGHLPEALRTSTSAQAEAMPSTVLPRRAAELRDQLIALLSEHEGNIAEVARVLGKGRTQIHRWVKRYSIDLDRFRGRG